MKKEWRETILEMGDEIFDLLFTWALIGAGIVYLALVIRAYMGGGA